MITARLKKGDIAWETAENQQVPYRRAEIPVLCGKGPCRGTFGAMVVFAQRRSWWPEEAILRLWPVFKVANSLTPDSSCKGLARQPPVYVARGPKPYTARSPSSLCDNRDALTRGRRKDPRGDTHDNPPSGQGGPRRPLAGIHFSPGAKASRPTPQTAPRLRHWGGLPLSPFQGPVSTLYLDKLPPARPVPPSS